MREEANSLKCGREQDLIDCIYGELDASEMRSFNIHLKSCSDCSSQLAEFKSVREALVAWRDESLGFVSPQIGNSAAAGIRNQPPSAIAAIREFFNLSPLWMKGAVAFASLLFCLLAVLAVARLRDTPPAVVAIDYSNNAHAQQEFNAEVERRVQAELKRLEETRQASVFASADKTPPAVAQPGQVKHRNQIASSPTQKARRPLSKSEREQLAADLRLIEGPAEGGLELLADRVNQ
jgi:anti-sigma factor RsiW